MKKLLVVGLTILLSVCVAFAWDLSDPGEDKLIGWDDSAPAGTQTTWFGVGTGLEFNGTNIQVTLGTTAGTVSEGDHDHSGTYEPADATILKAANIGAGGTVQAHDDDLDSASTGSAAGNSKFWGTSGAGAVGWFDQSTIAAEGVPDGTSVGQLLQWDGDSWEPISELDSMEISGGTASTISIWDADQKLVSSTYSSTPDENLASVASTHTTLPSAKAVKERIQYKSWSFDPDAVCDGAVDRLFLMSAHGGQGIKITAWKVSFEADPTTEADLDLKRADAWIGVANAAVMDVLDTTNGAASESTAANINSDAAVAEGKVIYLEFGTAYTESNHQIIFEMWYYEVGN